MSDLVVRGGTVVTPAGEVRADIAIEDGHIAAVGPDLPGGRDEIDAHGLAAFGDKGLRGFSDVVP